MKHICLLLATLALSAGVQADLLINSGSKRISLVELYTSEGCSSCPPADRFLSTLKEDPRLFKEYIPVAFHVDYWDYLGWKDPFANNDFSERQRTYHQVGRTRAVYTPGFVVNGEEWRGFFNPLRRQLPNHDPSEAGNLRLLYSKGRVQIDFTSEQSHKDLFAYVAQLGTDLSNQVSRGENKGKRLSHDFVVLSLEKRRLNKSGQVAFKDKREEKAQAIAAWVSKADDPAPIQSVAGWLAVHEASQ